MTMCAGNRSLLTAIARRPEVGARSELDEDQHIDAQAHSELEQLTLDPAIAPFRVLLSWAHHQGDRLVIDGRTTW